MTVEMARKMFQVTSKDFIAQSWFLGELTSVLQGELRRLMREKDITNAEELSAALRIEESFAQELWATLEWPLEVQLAALERLSDLAGSGVGAGEFISGLWLASKFGQIRRDVPRASSWRLGSGDLTVLLDGPASRDIHISEWLPPSDSDEPSGSPVWLDLDTEAESAEVGPLELGDTAFGLLEIEH